MRHGLARRNQEREAQPEVFVHLGFKQPALEPLLITQRSMAFGLFSVKHLRTSPKSPEASPEASFADAERADDPAISGSARCL